MYKYYIKHLKSYMKIQVRIFIYDFFYLVKQFKYFVELRIKLSMLITRKEMNI